MGKKKPQRKGSKQAYTSKAQSKVWWQQPWVTAAASLGIVVLVVIGIIIFGNKPTVTQPPAGVWEAVTHPNATVVSKVGAGTPLDGTMVRLPGSDITKGPSGKPLVVYVGGEFCPFCAAERWSMVMALSRFGTFTGVGFTTSSSTDAFPDTNTFTFHGSTYTSDWIEFSPNEIEDRNQQPLDSMSSQVAEIFQTLSAPPYTANKGGFPFADIAGRWVVAHTGVHPQILQGLTWEQIAAKLSDPTDNVTTTIIGHANQLTAAICVVTNNQPTDVCSAPYIAGIEKTLNTLPLPTPAPAPTP